MCKPKYIPIQKIPEITDVPIIWRYFVAPLASVLARLQLDEKEYVARTVMKINSRYARRVCIFKRQKHGRVQGSGISRRCRTVL